MTWLLDTNVISEPTKRAPAATVMAWVRAQDQTTLYTHALTLAEIQYGIECSNDTAWRGRLSQWLDARVRPLFAGRVIDADEVTWGVMLRMMARTRAAGRTTPVADLIIAASAERHGLTIVTRNLRDFAGTGVRALNPWLASPVTIII